MEYWLLIGLGLIIISTAIFIMKKEPMRYLDQYELQDRYKNDPEAWPISYTPVTANYAIRRMANSM